MTAFSIGSFASADSDDMTGQGFSPSVSGPDGSGSPGSSANVILNSFTAGYQLASTTGRATMCFVYSVALTDPSDIGSHANLLGVSSGTSDGSAFGTGTHSRTFTFGSLVLSASGTYFIYFSDYQLVRIEDGPPYSGGVAYDDSCTETTYSLQFKIDFTTVS